MDGWMTYEEAAQRLGIKTASVKRQARARNWPRRLSNDGRAQVQVPADRLTDPPPSSPPVTPPDTFREEAASRIAAAEARADAAERRASEIAEERDKWRTMAENLRTDLATERERSAARPGLLTRLFGR